ncbi:MAG: exodeoxyribonuclease VII small subunit [Polyangiales bacterium]
MASPSSRKNPEPAPEEASFESILDRLETVVARLEGGDLPLEESLAVFEEGVKLARDGQKRLDAAERRVEALLSADDGTVTTRPITAKEP